jgi:hypothetical protein
MKSIREGEGVRRSTGIARADALERDLRVRAALGQAVAGGHLVRVDLEVACLHVDYDVLASVAFLIDVGAHLTVVETVRS